MVTINSHQNILIQLICALLMSCSICYAKTVTESLNNGETTTDCQEMNGKLSALTATVEQLVKESKILKHKVADLEIKNHMTIGIENHRNEYPPYLLNNSGSGRNGKELVKTHRIHKRVPELPPVRIAFHAIVSHDTPTISNVIIKFDITKLDTANAYNNKSGVFTVPESGIYVLSWIISVDGHSQAFTHIMVNGESQGKTLADSRVPDNEGHSATGIIVIHLSQGDQVNVQHEPILNQGTLDTQYSLNSFSGWMLD